MDYVLLDTAARTDLRAVRLLELEREHYRAALRLEEGDVAEADRLRADLAELERRAAVHRAVLLPDETPPGGKDG